MDILISERTYISDSVLPLKFTHKQPVKRSVCQFYPLHPPAIYAERPTPSGSVLFVEHLPHALDLYVVSLPHGAQPVLPVALLRLHLSLEGHHVPPRLVGGGGRGG